MLLHTILHVYLHTNNLAQQQIMLTVVPLRGNNLFEFGSFHWNERSSEVQHATLSEGRKRRWSD